MSLISCSGAVADQYAKSTLSESDVDPSPEKQFRTWFDQAVEAKIPIPEAMNLATAELPSGRVSNRTVLMKELDAKGNVVCYSNWSTSRKAHDLSTNPWVSVTFFWKELERQVRVEGKARLMTPEESQAYFDTRPRRSRLSAWSSPQSEKIPDRDYLEKKIEETDERFEGKEKFPVPPFWGGLEIHPEHWEFWQGRPNRIHDRIVYDRDGSGWKISRIAP